MNTREKVLEALNNAVEVLDQATKEKEKMLSDLLGAFKVSNIFKLDDPEAYALGAELDNQIDTFKDLRDDLKFKIYQIGEFEE